MFLTNKSCMHFSVCIVLVLLMLSVPLRAMASADVVFFPDAEAENLNEEIFKLPADFAGNPSIVVLAFEREQQALVDPWLEKLAVLSEEFSELRYYELPTIDRYNRLMRWWIARGMRSGIEDTAQRGRTLTLHLEDKAQFLKDLDIDDISTVHTLMLDDEGYVHARVKGTMTEEKWSVFAREVREYIRLQVIELLPEELSQR